MQHNNDIHLEVHEPAFFIHFYRPTSDYSRPQTLSYVHVLGMCNKMGKGREGKGLGTRLTFRWIQDGMWWWVSNDALVTTAAIRLRD